MIRQEKLSGYVLQNKRVTFRATEQNRKEGFRANCLEKKKGEGRQCNEV